VAAPDREPRRRARVLVATVLCIATVWAVGGVSVWSGGDGRDRTTGSDTESAGSASTDPAGAGAAPVGTSTVPATTLPATTAMATTVPATTVPGVTPVTITSQTPLGERPPALAGTVVTAPDGSFAITLPTDWQVGFPSPDVPPEVEMLETPDTQMFALAPTPGADGSALLDGMLQIDGHDGAGLDNLTAYAAVRIVENRGTGGPIMGEGTFDSASGPVGWAAFQDHRSRWYVVRYLVVGGDWEWTVSYWTRAPAVDHALADQIVASLTPSVR
jgi:hypothetical protein